MLEEENQGQQTKTIKEFFKGRSDLWLLLYIPIFLAGFFLVEKLVPDGSAYWVSYCRLDDMIPFDARFVIFYALWAPLIFAVGIFLLIYDVPVFKYYMIIALAITMLTVSGLGANKAYAGTSTSTSGVKYAVTIRDNSKTTTLYIDSEKTPAEIKSGIESYVKAQNSSVIKVSFDEDASIEVTPLSGTGKTYSTLALTTAAENADSIDAMLPE